VRPALTHHHDGFPVGVDLDDAREALAYWESRAERLPRRAVRRRREAVEMARRWHERVVAAERAAYGRGLVGALLLAAGEGRVPQSLRHTGRALARRSRQAMLVGIALVLTLMMATLFAAAELLLAVAHAVS